MKSYTHHSIKWPTILIGFAICFFIALSAQAQHVIVKYAGYTYYRNVTTKIPFDIKKSLTDQLCSTQAIRVTGIRLPITR